MAFQLSVEGAINFRKLDPQTTSAGAERFFCPYGRGGEVVIEASGTRSRNLRWKGTPLDGIAAGGAAGHADGRRFVIAHPAEPMALQVSCRAGAKTEHLEIWYVSGSLALRKQGRSGANNPRWAQIVPLLQKEYASGTAHDFSALGLTTFPLETTHQRGRLYGGFVETIGAVRPANVPSRFYQARQIVYAAVSAFDSEQRPVGSDRAPQGGVPRIGTKDPSGVQVWVLTAVGQTFGYELTGSVMNAANHRGDTHCWRIVSERLLAIGSIRSWDETVSLGSAISPILRSTTEFTARSLSDIGTPIPEIAIFGSLG